MGVNVFDVVMPVLCLVLMAANVPRLKPEIYWPVGLFAFSAN